MWSYIFVDLRSRIAVDFYCFRIDWDFGIRSIGKFEFCRCAENGLRIEFIDFVGGIFRIVPNESIDFLLPEETFLIVFQDLIPLFLQFFCSLQLWFENTLPRCPFLLQSLQPPNFNLMKIILLFQYFEFFFHSDDKFVFHLL